MVVTHHIMAIMIKTMALLIAVMTLIMNGHWNMELNFLILDTRGAGWLAGLEKHPPTL